MEGQSSVGLVELDCLELEGEGSLPTHLQVGVESTSMASGEQARGRCDSIRSEADASHFVRHSFISSMRIGRFPRVKEPHFG
jgi:hypothetical protein